ncbi:Slp family lipoprotein [Alteromonas sp. LMIT006]|jgi:outer membrane lipoprotein|uniref:Slp family lipoprotein n=1 Tax=Alteromonadaceae TaxID=72275 RepID=UPI0020CA54DE|nr:Slp family lipoprotein [Alteromonas sp. LMIT006]UTP72529.1 Slp family lipoprotein [Alteromonas sp. LMIT006]
MLNKTLKPLSVLLLALGVTACVSIPESLQSPATNMVSYENAVMDNAPTGTVARWGGVIANVENTPEQSIMEIVHYPLKANGRPNLRQASIGRFKAVVDGFIDPMVFKKDRVVSVLGSLAEPMQGMVGEQAYTYPSLQVSGYHLWEDVQDVDITTIHHDHFYRFGHGYGFHYIGVPYRRIRHLTPMVKVNHSTVRIRSNNTQSSHDVPRNQPTAPTDNRGQVIEPTVPPPKPQRQPTSNNNPRERGR